MREGWSKPSSRSAVRRFVRANSVDEALDMLKERPADVVLADVGLPGKDGYDFVRGLRALEGDRTHTAVAAVTAYARLEDRDSLLAAGFDAHVPEAGGAAGSGRHGH